MLEIVSGQGWLQRSLGQIFCLGVGSPAVDPQTRGEDDGSGSVPRKNRWMSGKCEQKGEEAGMSWEGGSGSVSREFWKPGLWSCSHGTKELHQSHQSSPVAQSCLSLCDPTDCSAPGLPVHHQLPELTQTHVHRVGDAIQPSHPLCAPHGCGSQGRKGSLDSTDHCHQMSFFF